MKKFLLSCLFISCSLLGSAQMKISKNSIRLAADYTTIGVTDQQATVRYSLIYARHLSNDRLTLESSLGYAFHYLPATSSHQEAHFSRTTADFSLLYTILKSSRHGIRLGAGPSLWYRQESVALSTDTPVLPTGDVIKFSLTNPYQDGLKAGLNVVSEYSYSLSSCFTLGGRVSMFYVNSNIIPALGLTTGFNF
ncbi:hypothetical protein [Spirosoma aerophilum]